MSLNAKLAAFFLARPYEPISPRTLAEIAGFAGWRTRVSQIRKQPYSMDIRCDVERVQRGDQSIQVSSYRFIPAEQKAEVA